MVDAGPLQYSIRWFIISSADLVDKSGRPIEFNACDRFPPLEEKLPKNLPIFFAFLIPLRPAIREFPLPALLEPPTTLTNFPAIFLKLSVGIFAVVQFVVTSLLRSPHCGCPLTEAEYDFEHMVCFFE